MAWGPTDCKTLSEPMIIQFADAPWRRHQMETFSALLAICAGNSPVTDEFPTQRPVTRSFDVLFDLRLNKPWINNREAGDLRSHGAHYEVIVMTHASPGLLREINSTPFIETNSNPSSLPPQWKIFQHYSDVTMSAMASQITGVFIVCAVNCSGAYQRKH